MKPVQRDPDDEKDKVKVQIRNACRDLTSRSRRHDLLQTSGGELSVFVTYSRAYEDGKYFYDVHENDIQDWLANFRSSYVVFIAGSSETAFVVPVEHLYRALRAEGRKPTDGNAYKLHLAPEQQAFREAPSLHLNSFRNLYSSLGTTDTVLRERPSASTPALNVKIPDATHGDLPEVSGKPLSDRQQLPKGNVSSAQQASARTVAIEPSIFRRLEAEAQRQSISVETLVNVWLLEKLQQAERGRV